MSRSTRLVFLMLLAVLGSTAAQDSAFVKPLEDLILLKRAEEMRNLSCELQHQANEIVWHINSTIVRESQLGAFTFSHPMQTSVGTLQAVATFPQSPIVNNTNITCTGFTLNYTLLGSSTATLIVVDVPLQPFPRISITDLHTVHVSWDAPFSWPSHPITSYNISMMLTNGQSDSLLLNGNIFSHNFTLDYTTTTCTNVTVWLKAENEVGISLPGTASNNLPSAPGEFEEPTTSVTFTKENLPRVQVAFKFPALCEDTGATFILTLYDEQGQNVYTSKETSARWTEGGKTLTIDIQNNAIKNDAKYQIVLFVRTAAGTQNTTTSIDTIRGHSTEPRIAGLVPMSGNSTYIIGTGAGGFVILLLIILIVIVAGILYWRRKLESRKRVCSETVLKKMVPNPVYDNQTEVIYDEIPYDSSSYLRSLPIQLEGLDEGYTSVSTTPEQVRMTRDIKPDNSQDAGGEEDYTEMKSIGTVLPRLSLLSDDTTADQAELSRTTEKTKRPENQYHFK